ncbi:YlmH family RNA-binding protein [Bacillus sp. 2205SS5-2]|uniref:YlmH family RNA-binding protein n=1 Tax=Bacillus sp. 2205SS5-2 TaxID=3109031 RepID=UPI003004B9D7
MNLYQHFREEERAFVDYVLQWVQEVENQYAPRLTDFLDPRQQFIVTSIVGNREDILIAFGGGSEQSERKRCLLYPSYFEPQTDDYQTALFSVSYQRKFITLEHRQMLGSLMSLGIKREKFGDIVLRNGDIQFFAVKELASYIEMNLTHIGKAGVKVTSLPPEEAITADEEWVEVVKTASSLRLDVVLSTVINMSRSKAQSLITSGKVKVNWQEIESVSFTCDTGDVLSIKGFGRVKILSLDGKTKREKWRMTAGFLK